MKKIMVVWCASMLFLGAEAITKRMDPWIPFNIKTYDQLKEVFTKRMYYASGGSLPYKNYALLVNTFLTEAEKKQLNVIKYCKDRPQKKLAHILLQDVIVYAVGNFRYQFGLARERPYLTDLRVVLSDIHEQVKEKFDVESELSSLVQLIQDANKAFYRSLPLFTRFFIFAAPYFQ